MFRILAYIPNLDDFKLETKEEKIVFFSGIIVTLLIWFVLDVLEKILKRK